MRQLPSSPTTLFERCALIFDVGANIGEKTILYLQAGVIQVVCFEPQHSCLEILNQRFSLTEQVLIDGRAVSDSCGEALFFPCQETTVLSTLSTEWFDSRFRELGYHWSDPIRVETVTLDVAIEEYGVPDYIKIDVEGFEPVTLNGLSRLVPFISVEFAQEKLSLLQDCGARLQHLGYTDFTVEFGESLQFSYAWQPWPALMAELQNNLDPLLWGNVYAAVR